MNFGCPRPSTYGSNLFSAPTKTVDPHSTIYYRKVFLLVWHELDRWDLNSFTVNKYCGYSD
jgi:hypothetical protein